MRIDFHSHVLPGADHGSRELATSLSQLALARAAGIGVLVATPHFYPRKESVSSFLQRREECANVLRSAMPGHAPKLLIGAEVQLCRGFEHLEKLPQLCIQGTSVLLLELPPVFSTEVFLPTLDALRYAHKLTVVLAHIDRYDPVIINELLELGLLAQLNADGFCHLRTRRRCLSWAQSPSVVALGSDLHGLSEGYRSFERAEKLLGSALQPLTERTQALLQPLL